MRIIFFGVFTLALLLCAREVFAQNKPVTIDVEWNKSFLKGTVTVDHGAITEVQVVKGRGRVKGNSFEATSDKGVRIRVKIENASLAVGPDPTVISIKAAEHSFSFFAPSPAKKR